MSVPRVSYLSAVFLVFVVLPFVSADPFTDATGATFSDTFANWVNGWAGMKFVVLNTNGVTFHNATLAAGSNATKMTLQYANHTNISSMAISNNVSVFNINLSAGTYYILAGGANYTHPYTLVCAAVGTGAFPIGGANINYTAYWDGLADYTNRRACNIVSATTSNITVSTSTPTAHVRVQDLYDSANLQGLNVTWANNKSNTTGADGIAYCYNCSGQSFNVTDPSGKYFTLTGQTATENATTTVKVYGAFINITAYNIANATVASFNASSGAQINATNASSLRLVLRPNASNNVTIAAQNYYVINVTIATGLQTLGGANATGLYQSEINISALNFVTNTAVLTFTANSTGPHNGTKSTTNGTMVFHALFGNYNFTIDAPNFVLSTKNLTVDSPTENLSFTLFTNNTINITFYDEQDGKLINFENVTLQYFGEFTSGVLTTSSGTLNISLLVPDTYTLVADSPSYLERFYLFTLVDRTFNYLNLTLLNASTGELITITVKDTLDNPVSGAVVKVQRYNIVNNDYETVEIRTTNAEGVTVADMTINDDIYKFVVERDDVVVLVTTPSQIYSNTVTLIIDVTPAGFDTTFTKYRLSGTVTYVNASNTCRFVYNDDTNTADGACITAYTYGDSREIYNQTCSGSSSGTVSTRILNTTGTAYQCVGTITASDGQDYLIDQLFLSFPDTIPGGGSTAIMMFFIFIVFVTAFIAAGIEIAVIVGGFIPLMFTAMQLTPLDYYVTVPVFAAGIIVAFIIGVIRR